MHQLVIFFFFFKQKTAYEISACLVGSEMCIRDRIGATERPGTVGRTVLENLRHPSFQGKVYAVNSRHAEVCGLKAYPSIGAVPDQVDLAVVATPAITVP